MKFPTTHANKQYLLATHEPFKKIFSQVAGVSVIANVASGATRSHFHATDAAFGRVNVTTHVVVVKIESNSDASTV